MDVRLISVDEEHRSPIDGTVELHCCGVIDTLGTSLATDTKFNQALQAIYLPHGTSEHFTLPTEFPSHLYREPASFLSRQPGQDDLWEIKYDSTTFANEYDPNFLPSAFPTLYPFGIGGIQDPNRPINVGSMQKHVRILLLQSHEAFARHETFMFVVFNVLQRRQICLGSRLVANQYMVPEVCEILRGLDLQTVRNSLEEVSPSAKRLPAGVDPRLTKLMELTAIASNRCLGSQEYFQQRRIDIRALFVRFGGPHFFITINPDDARHPLVLSFSQSAPTSVTQSFVVSIPANSRLYVQRRYKLIAQNPVIQAQFFDTIFKAVLDHVFGFARDDRIGILGKVAAHYALVEAQGKGTLHAHTLVWLEDGMTLHLIRCYFPNH